MDLRVWVAGFPVQMTVVTMVTVVTVVNMVTVVTVVIMVTVVLSTHPKVMHQILQLWQEKKNSQCTECAQLQPRRPLLQE